MFIVLLSLAGFRTEIQLPSNRALRLLQPSYPIFRVAQVRAADLLGDIVAGLRGINAPTVLLYGLIEGEEDVVEEARWNGLVGGFVGSEPGS